MGGSSSTCPTVLAHCYFANEPIFVHPQSAKTKVAQQWAKPPFPRFQSYIIMLSFIPHHRRSGPSALNKTCSYSITAPPTTTANPPATDQSGNSEGAAAADLGEAVLAGLEVAVLLVELVLELETILKQRTLVAASLGSIETGTRCYVPELALSPLLVPPVSPLPLEPTGV